MIYACRPHDEVRRTGRALRLIPVVGLVSFVRWLDAAAALRDQRLRENILTESWIVTLATLLAW